MPDQLQGIVQRMIDAGESEENIATVIRHFKSQAHEPPPVERGGLRHPLTSVIAPELAAARSKVNEALPVEHGQPVMARSRTGALYQSETGPSTVGGAARNIGHAAADAAIGQVEAATSPLGLAAYGVSKIPVAPVANAAASVLENVPAAKSLIPFANPAKNVIPFEKMAGRLRTIAQTSTDADMGVTRGADMYEMQRFPRSTEATARVPMAHGEPAAITDAERIKASTDQAVADGLLRRKPDVTPAPTPSLRTRFPNGLPVEAPAAAPIQPVPSHAPFDFAAIEEQAARRAQQIANVKPASVDVPTGHGAQPDNLLDLVPESSDVAPRPVMTPESSPLQQPRMNIGAEKVGRANGMTTGEVRQQAGPVLGEARGEASPVFPQGPFDRMADTLKAMKPEDRLAYVMKAGDVKTQAQLETIRRVMAKYGLVIPLAATVAPSVRDMLLQQMRAGVTGRGTAQ